MNLPPGLRRLAAVVIVINPQRSLGHGIIHLIMDVMVLRVIIADPGAVHIALVGNHHRGTDVVQHLAVLLLVVADRAEDHPQLAGFQLKALKQAI